MKKKLETDAVIETLITASLGKNAGARERHVYRESLRNLVRMAKAEQVIEIKDSVKKLTAGVEMQTMRRRVKAILSTQQQFEFKD